MDVSFPPEYDGSEGEKRYAQYLGTKPTPNPEYGESHHCRSRLLSSTMTSLLRVTRQTRPIQPKFARCLASKPSQPPTITHTPIRGEKSIPVPEQTTAHVPAPTPPPEYHAPIPADIVSGAPEDLHRRTVRIYRPAKGAMQSGLHGNLYWRLDWDVKPEDNRWEHPVMYWPARSSPPFLILIEVGITCKPLEWFSTPRKTPSHLQRNKVCHYPIRYVDVRLGILYSRTS